MAIFPADNSWNQDISAAPVDPYSSQIIAAISTSALKADFGSRLYDGVPIGIPFDVVCGSQPNACQPGNGANQFFPRLFCPELLQRVYNLHG